MPAWPRELLPQHTGILLGEKVPVGEADTDVVPEADNEGDAEAVTVELPLDDAMVDGLCDAVAVSEPEGVGVKCEVGCFSDAAGLLVAVGDVDADIVADALTVPDGDLLLVAAPDIVKLIEDVALADALRAFVAVELEVPDADSLLELPGLTDAANVILDAADIDELAAEVADGNCVPVPLAVPDGVAGVVGSRSDAVADMLPVAVLETVALGDRLPCSDTLGELVEVWLAAPELEVIGDAVALPLVVTDSRGLLDTAPLSDVVAVGDALPALVVDGLCDGNGDNDPAPVAVELTVSDAVGDDDELCEPAALGDTVPDPVPEGVGEVEAVCELVAVTVFVAVPDGDSVPDGVPLSVGLGDDVAAPLAVPDVVGVRELVALCDTVPESVADGLVEVDGD